MNERIRQLAEQAGFDVKRIMEPYPGGFPREDMLALESFAELLIKECILIVKMGITRDGNNTEKYLRSMEHIRQIEKHFGVE